MKLQDKLTKVMDLVIKMNLSQEQKLRGLIGATLETIRAPVNVGLITYTKAAVMQYFCAFKSLKADKEGTEKLKDQLGPMGVHVFNGTIKWCLASQSKALGVEDLRLLQEAPTTWETWNVIHRHIPHCKIVKS